MRSSKWLGLQAAIVAVVAAAVVLVGTPAQAGTGGASSAHRTTVVQTVAKTHTPYGVRPGTTSSFTGPDFTLSGIVFKFNRTETYYIGSGAGMCALIVGKLPSLFAKVASLGCGVLAWKAAQLLYQNKCMKLVFSYNPILPNMGVEGWNC